MSMFKKVKKNFLFMSLSLIITFVLLTSLNPARAETIEQDVFNFGPVSFVPLLMGQSYTLKLTLSGSFGFHTIVITSLGNPTLSVDINNMDDGSAGFWNVSIVGTGGRQWGDNSFGIWPYDGDDAQIDVNSNLSFAVATGVVFLWNLGTDTFPVKYRLKVGP